MCLAIPVRVKELLDASSAKVEVDGISIDVSTVLVTDLKVGDYVILHAGFILEKLTEEDALDKLSLWDEYYKKQGIINE